MSDGTLCRDQTDWWEGLVACSRLDVRDKLSGQVTFKGKPEW